MKFFVDTADVDAIRELHDLGMVDGVTTNPSLIMKSGRDIRRSPRKSAPSSQGPVSAETVALDADGMIAEGRKLAKIADNIAIKVPLTWDGLKACKVLTGRGPDGQRHAVLLGQPGAAGGQGRSDVHLALHRPARRPEHRRHGPDRGHPADLRQLMASRRRFWRPRSALPTTCPRPPEDRRGRGDGATERDQGDGEPCR